MPDFGEDRADWEPFLRSYCKERAYAVSAAMVTMQGVLVVAILPHDIDERRFKVWAAEIVFSAVVIVAECMPKRMIPITFLNTEFGQAYVCCYPKLNKVLITLCNQNPERVTGTVCPDLCGPIVTKAYVPIVPLPEYDFAAAEYDQELTIQ